MPQELGGKVYTIRNFIPRSVMRKIRKYTPQSAEDYDPDQYDLLVDTVLINLVISPKITKEILDSEDCNGVEMEILATTIMEELGIDEKRIVELKKKVVKQ